MSNSAPGRSRPTPPSLRNSSARPSSPVSGLCAFTWKPMAMSIGVSAASRSASTRSGSPLAIAAERAVGEHVKARHAQPFGARVGLAGAGLAVRPGRTRAGVEQHRHDGEIHAAARDLLLRQSREPSAPAPPSGRGRPPRNAASANGRECRPDWGSAGASPRASPARPLRARCASSANHADRPSSTYFSICSARSRIAAGVRSQARSSVMAGSAPLQWRVFVDAREDRATGVARPQRSLIQAPPLGLHELGRPGLGRA